MSDTLYRIIPWDHDDRTPRVTVAPQEQLQAVEIDYEIDYEAATDALVDVISGGPSGATDDEVAARIVHAALGIGGDDDSSG